MWVWLQYLLPVHLLPQQLAVQLPPLAAGGGGDHTPELAEDGEGREGAEGEGGGEGVEVCQRHNHMLCAHIDVMNHSLKERRMGREERGGEEREGRGEGEREERESERRGKKILHVIVCANTLIKIPPLHIKNLDLPSKRKYSITCSCRFQRYICHTFTCILIN